MSSSKKQKIGNVATGILCLVAVGLVLFLLGMYIGGTKSPPEQATYDLQTDDLVINVLFRKDKENRNVLEPSYIVYFEAGGDNYIVSLKYPEYSFVFDEKSDKLVPSSTPQYVFDNLEKAVIVARYNFLASSQDGTGLDGNWEFAPMTFLEQNNPTTQPTTAPKTGPTTNPTTAPTTLSYAEDLEADCFCLRPPARPSWMLTDY